MSEEITAPKSVNPFTALTKYADFSGRARRSEYWLFALISLAKPHPRILLLGQGIRLP